MPSLIGDKRRGIRGTITEANKGVIEIMESVPGISFTNNVYDPEFITDLIQAEYGDFV